MKFLRCEVCGKMVAVVEERGCPTKCCGQAMVEVVPNTQDGAHEKHIPVYEVKDGVVHVKVGEVDHPMLEAHYIEWVMLQTKAGNQRKLLKPGEAPEARFLVAPEDEVLAVYEYCNLHGLYKA